MDRSYPYSRRLVSRARLRKRMAVVTALGLLGASAVFMLTWKPDPISAVPSFMPTMVLNDPFGAGDSLQRGVRRIYPYSVVPGGVSDGVELKRIIRTDGVVAAHYATFDAVKARAVVVDAPRAVHVSYRKGDKVYWTAHKVMLAPGETLLSDGRSEMRARCANRISDLPQYPVEAHKPAMEELDHAVELADGEEYTLGPDGMPVAMGGEGGIGRHTGGVRGPTRFGSGGASNPADGTLANTSSSGASMGLVSTMGLSGSSSSLGSRPRPAGVPAKDATVMPTSNPAATPGSGSNAGMSGSPAPSGGATTPVASPGSGSVETVPGAVAGSGGGSSGSPASSDNTPTPVVEPDRSSPDTAPGPIPGTTTPQSPTEGSAPPSIPELGPRPGTPLPPTDPAPEPNPGPTPLPVVEAPPGVPAPPAVPPAPPQPPQPGPVPPPGLPKPEPLPPQTIEQPAPTEVPEPGSLWLFGLALAAMGVLRRARGA